MTPDGQPATPAGLRPETAVICAGRPRRAGSPMPSASLMRSSVAMLGLAEPCSMLTSILRLTPERSASWSRVQARLDRPCRTRPPIARVMLSAPARASESDCLIQGIILHYRQTGEAHDT